MATIVEQANKKIVMEIMDNKAWMNTLCQVLKKMRGGFFDRGFQDAIIQKWDRFGDFDFYDALPFARVWAMMCAAQVVCARVHIGHVPLPDKDIEGNNELLKKLWYPFSGFFVGGTQDEDGYIDIAKEIDLDAANLETGKRVVEKCSGYFPLEVGYISAAKTQHYLYPTRGRLARWPYGSEDIYLFQTVSGPVSELENLVPVRPTKAWQQMGLSL